MDNEKNYDWEDNGIFSKMKKMFSNPKTSGKTKLSANEAYLKTRYGKIETKEERYKSFLERLNKEILFKCQVNEYFCAMEVPSELADEYMEQIISEYKDGGYSIVDMRTVIKDLNAPIIFVSWSVCKE